ncbi:YhcN/YlaJ family sporulation lipoprotein [Oceanobacillus sp. CAU 1775]
MFKKIIIMIALFLLVGCGNDITLKNTNDDLNRPHPQQLRNQWFLKEELDYYEEYVDVRRIQTEKLSDNDMEHYTDPYTTEESQRIAKELMKNRDIVMTEVRVIDDQVFVALRLRDNVFGRNHDMNVVPEIEEQVQEMINDENKRVIVFSDHSHWQRLKEHHAKPQIDSIFNDFFNVDN